MKKSFPIIGIIILLLAGCFYMLDFKSTKTVDWEESFNEKSTKPYGLSVFYKELKHLFKDQKIRTVYHTPSSYLIANSEDGYGDHVAEGNFFIIGNSDYMYDTSIDELLKFTSNGNTLFISDYIFSSKLTDTLGIEIDYKQNKADSISHFDFTDLKLKSINTSIDKNEANSYFTNTNNYNVLGYVNHDETLPNYIEVPHGEGYIYLHLEPKVFTNYNLLKGDNYKYVEGLLSYLPNKNVYFDSYSKLYTNYDGDVEQNSNLSWFLQQRSFKWAWYFALLLTLIFIVFNAKRRQRIIKIIKPLENSSLAFVNTISNVYFETQDHGNIINKRITYFLEQIRLQYHIDTSNLNDEFIVKLASKSGVKKAKTEKLINYINWLQTKSEFFEDNLITLNRHIEAFYSH